MLGSGVMMPVREVKLGDSAEDEGDDAETGGVRAEETGASVESEELTTAWASQAVVLLIGGILK